MLKNTRQRALAGLILLLLESACGRPSKPKFGKSQDASPTDKPATHLPGSTTDEVPTSPNQVDPETAAAIPLCDTEKFGQAVWAPTLSQRCQSCHIKNGLAPKNGSAFILSDATEPDYMNKNFAAFQKLAAIQYEGTPLILAKASNKAKHAGGKILDVDSAAYVSLNSFIGDTALPKNCLKLTAETTAKLDVRSPAQIVRQASLQLAGRQPADSELQLAKDGKIRDALDTVLKGEYFETFIKRIYNDIFLGDGFRGDNAIEVYYRSNGQASLDWRDDNLYYSVYASFPEYQNSVELVSYIIANNRPYTEILTADYLMLNPHSACDILGPNHDLKFSNKCSTNGQALQACNKQSFRFGHLPFGDYIDDCREFLPSKPKFGNGAPIVGVLSDIPFLVRYSTTPSNRNRLRARIIYKHFLGLDVLTLQGPQQPSTESASPIANPTMNNPECAACHTLVDPIASSLQRHNELGRYDRNAKWEKDMFAAGFNGKTTPNDAEPLRWLADEMVKDPRFARSAVMFWFQALTGEAPLRDPVPSDAYYRVSLAAKLAQNEFFENLAQKFAANKFNTREMIKDILVSPYYSAVGIKADVTASEKLMLESFDHANRRAPEETHQALAAVTGQFWLLPDRKADDTYTTFKRWDDSYLMNAGQLLVTAGGVDSKTAIVRNNDMSSIASAISNFAAVSMPCQVVSKDFKIETAKRNLFPLVEINTVPDDGAGSTRIKQNIAYMHKRVLGEELAIDNPELIATYTLFVQLYNNHKSAGDKTLNKSCQTQGITSDDNYTLHAWMGVLSYLLNDYDFIYQ
ncbi:MAG: DUF1588 domain-containing protein [Proteobacteria bacterium]|nr:MAG: DUF1588 domain-containing protein [Pseudomonadota bacterium]